MTLITLTQQLTPHLKSISQVSATSISGDACLTVARGYYPPLLYIERCKTNYHSKVIPITQPLYRSGGYLDTSISLFLCNHPPQLQCITSLPPVYYPPGPRVSPPHNDELTPPHPLIARPNQVVFPVYHRLGACDLQNAPITPTFISTFTPTLIPMASTISCSEFYTTIQILYFYEALIYW